MLSIEDVVAELDALIELTPAPAPRPLRDPDPPNPRTWNYTKPGVPFRHLVVRFLRSMRPGGPTARARLWARGLLADPEWDLFSRQAGFDQRHAIGVARAVFALTDNPLAARAALVHDIGKLDCGLGPVGRSGATLFRMLLPHLADRWGREVWREVVATPDARSAPRRLRERFALYWMHPWIGRRMLESVGSDRDVAAWAELHHHWYIVEDLPFAWNEALALWYSDGD
ncbi:MAG: hypothetical protein IT198_13245 [Acidimicrobiia bacterium]|nr:hypothetical protein [Acidimicrobiia bacterium]